MNIPYHLSAADIAYANYRRFRTKEIIVQRRLHTLYLKSLGYDHQSIAQMLDLHYNTITNYLHLYQQAGIEALCQTRYQVWEGELETHQATIVSDLQMHPVHNLNQASDRIEQLTGLRRSATSVRNFLHSHGFKPRKTGQIPARADIEQQRTFHDTILQPLLKKAALNECKVLFVDSVHFVLGAFMATVWCLKRLVIKTNSGRFRLNLIGAIDALSGNFTGLYNTTYITASTVVELLTTLKKVYPVIPLYWVLDNARYQHCQWVIQHAALLDIKLIFLPTYSPNLNLIERLWKHIKKKVLVGKYFENKDTFTRTIISYINSLNDPKIKPQIIPLLNPEFQLFDHSQFYTV